MSELVKSIEKSVAFLKSRQLDGTVLLADLERLLEDLKTRKEKSTDENLNIEMPGD